MLQILCRILRPISGTVEVNGRVLDKIDEGFRRMDEGFKLIAKLIVEENEKTRKEILQALKL